MRYPLRVVLECLLGWILLSNESRFLDIYISFHIYTFLQKILGNPYFVLCNKSINDLKLSVRAVVTEQRERYRQPCSYTVVLLSRLLLSIFERKICTLQWGFFIFMRTDHSSHIKFLFPGCDFYLWRKAKAYNNT